MKKRILVDFDRVIHKYSKGWNGGDIYDGPVKGAIEAIKLLQFDGFEVVVFTSLSALGEARNIEVRKWLKKHGVEIQVTNTKLPAMAYIDDRAIRFTNWRDVLNYFT